MLSGVHASRGLPAYAALRGSKGIEQKGSFLLSLFSIVLASLHLQCLLFLLKLALKTEVK